MWSEGRYQFIPFVVTLVSIVFTDLLVGILIGLVVSVLFILNSNLRRPLRRIVETHIGGDVLHIELPNQASFLNRASLDKLFSEAAPDSSLLIDGSDTHYIDMLVLSRKQGEQITVDDNVQLTVIEIRNGKVRLGFSAPKHVAIHRQEIYERVTSTITNCGSTTEATM